MTTVAAWGAQESRWAAYDAAKARFHAVIAEQEAGRFATGTPEFADLVDRYVAARAEVGAARIAAWQGR